MILERSSDNGITTHLTIPVDDMVIGLLLLLRPISSSQRVDLSTFAPSNATCCIDKLSVDLRRECFQRKSSCRIMHELSNNSKISSHKDNFQINSVQLFQYAYTTGYLFHRIISKLILKFYALMLCANIKIRTPV